MSAFHKARPVPFRVQNACECRVERPHEYSQSLCSAVGPFWIVTPAKHVLFKGASNVLFGEEASDGIRRRNSARGVDSNTSKVGTHGHHQQSEEEDMPKHIWSFLQS
jgi:hypothetical protein